MTIDDLATKVDTLEKRFEDLMRKFNLLNSAILAGDFWKKVSVSLFGIVMFLAGSSTTVIYHANQPGHPVAMEKMEQSIQNAANERKAIENRANEVVKRLEEKIDYLIAMKKGS